MPSSIANGNRHDLILVAVSIAGFTAPIVCTRLPIDLLIRANYFRPLPDAYGAVSPLGRGMSSYPTSPHAWWPTIAQEYAAGMSGPKLARKYGVGSTRTIYLILEKVRRPQADT